MTQNQENNTEIEAVEVEAQDATEAVTEQQEEGQEQVAPTQQDDFDPKERVDITDPKVQRKFNDIYKQMKMSDARNKMLTDIVEKLDKQNKELASRFEQTDHAEAERILTSRLKEARESGDEDRADKILQEIIDFRVDSKLKKVEPKAPVVQQPVIDDADVQTVISLAEETDVRGNLLRPWISDKHPAHKNAMKLAGALAIEVNAEFGYVDVGEVMKRMDDAMKPKATPQGNSRAPDPMRGNLTNNPAKGKLKLSSQELAIAQKLGVKPEDYLKWKR
jgi:hypothetical protein